MTVPHLDRFGAKAWYEALRYEYLLQGMSEQDAVRYVNVDFCMAYSMAFYSGVVFGSLVEEYRP